MDSTPGIPATEDRPDVAAGVTSRLGQIAFFFLMQAAILFLAAGGLDWTWAWVFLGICLLSVSVNATFLLRSSPETVAERGRPKETKAWDKVVGGIYALALFFALPLVAGLDARFDWTQGLGATWNVSGAVLLTVGLGLGGWAMISNSFFSTAVRIQTDRGQTVCRTGPYRLVRHPGYAGFILQSLGTPLLLGSLWALIPGVVAAAFMIVRTFLEDRMLRAELPGYVDYAQDVRFRLLPGIW
jgi:protein-S-isoprenylcysteine O-methyltransferase Ste14